MLRAREVPQGVLAEVLYRHPRGQSLAHGDPYSTRQKNLAAVASGHDARAAVHVQTFVTLRGQHRLARMQTHPHEHPRAGRPTMSRQRALRAGRRRDGVAGAREDRHQAVALRSELDAAVGAHGTTQGRPVSGEYLGPTIPQPPRERRRALDVAEHQGDGPRGKLARR
jgi:hypothetical protein